MAALPAERVEKGRQRVGQFDVVRELSRSSIASVYEGYQPSRRRPVLIKSLHPQLAGDAEMRGRFEREAQALSVIQHEHIVNIIDYHADADEIYMITEWIGGGSVAEHYQKEGSLSQREALALCLDVLSGLAKAHESGIIHRDIKPSNLLVSRQSGIKITDFGLAHFEGSPSLTQQGMVVGTPAYMAPEFITGGVADARSDLYSLGVTLYELMTGENPFLADNVSETLNRVLSLKPHPLDGVDPTFHKLLFAMLEKRPERRPSSASEVYDQLLPTAQTLGVEKGWAELGKPWEPVHQESHPAIRRVTRSRPRRLLVWLGILAAVAVSTAVVILLQRSEPPLVPEPLPDTVSQAPAPSDTAVMTGGEADDIGRTSSEPIDDRSGEEVVQRPEVTPSERERTEPTPAPASTSPDTTVSGASSQDTEDTASEVTADEEQLAAEAASPGYLMLVVRPWADIFLNDSLIAQTPIESPLRLNSGEVDLTFTHPDFPDHTRSFTIVPNDTIRRTVNLLETVGVVESIQASPWADVYLDGDTIGSTPIATPLILPYGSYRLTFRHSTLPESTITIELQEGKEPLRVFVDLTSR
ncbi:protein kinase [bacterium]|nr:protein kinase [bacterium]